MQQLFYNLIKTPVSTETMTGFATKIQHVRNTEKYYPRRNLYQIGYQSLLQWPCFDHNQVQSQQIPYEVVPAIEPLHHSRDVMIGNQEIRLHAWLFDNVLPDLAHIGCYRTLIIRTYNLISNKCGLWKPIR